MAFSYWIGIPQIFTRVTLEWFCTSWGAQPWASRALQNFPPVLAEIRMSFPTSSAGISQNPGEIWVDFAGEPSGSSEGAAPQLQGWEEQSPPCQEIAEATGLAPAHGLLPTPQSQQVSTQDTAWDFPPFSKGQQALGFIVKPQKRSFFHLGHHSEPTGQHCLQSRFSTGFPNYFIDSGIFQGIDIILMFGGKMRFPSLPPASLPVLHHCCLSRLQDKSLVPSRGLKVRISFLSAANSHREGWR